MNELLEKVVAAHGGMVRWLEFSRVDASIVTSGALWGIKGLVQDPDPREMSVWLHEERASLKPFGNPDWHTEYTPRRIAIVNAAEDVISERLAPRDAFAQHAMNTAWDPLHRAYFNGYALWTYLTTPFLLALPGVGVTEIAPWTEGGETWRVLRAYFPESIATHSPLQEFYFGDDLLLRRHDYQVDVAGGFAAAQLVSDYIEADGIRLPSKRRAYLRAPDGQIQPEALMVSINISNVRFG